MIRSIGVIGLSRGANDKLIREKAYEIGRRIAQEGFVLISGATTGYTSEAVRGAYEKGGLTIGISPASNIEEHTNKYGMPVENFTRIIFTGQDYAGRNVIIVKSSDAIIMLPGSVGTLNEFTIALSLGKRIAILKEGVLREEGEELLHLVNALKAQGDSYDIKLTDDINEIIEFVRGE